MTKNDIIARLRELEIPFDASKKKADLAALLPADEQPEAGDDEEGFVFLGVDEMESITIRDVEFPVGVPVDLSQNPTLAAKLRALPYFEERG